MGKGTLRRGGFAYSSALVFLLGSVASQAEPVTVQSTETDTSSVPPASSLGAVVRNPAELADLSDLSDLAGMSHGQLPRLNADGTDEKSSNSPSVDASRSNSAQGQGRESPPAMMQKPSSSPSASPVQAHAQPGPLREFLDETGTTSVLKNVRAKLSQFNDNNEADVLSGAGARGAGGATEQERSEGLYPSDAAGPAKSGEEIRRDSVRASVLLALLIDEILPWVLGAAGVAIGLRAVQAFVRRQALRPRVHRSRSKSRSRSSTGSGRR